MPKGKMDINQNFEMLKAQMQAKRKKAEEQSKTKDEDKVNDIVQNEEPAANKKTKTKKAKKQVVKEEITKEEPAGGEVEISVKPVKSSVDIVEEKEVAVDTSKSLEEGHYIDESSKNSTTQPLEEYEDEIVEPVAPDKREVYKEDEIIYREEKSREASVKITIKKIEKPEAPKRATYYLMSDTIKKIEKISKITGMGKSKLVQTLLDQALENLEIEK